MTARKKAARKPAAKPAAAPRSKPAEKSPAKSARSESPAERLAQQLIKLTQSNGPYDLEALYTEDCISQEASGEPTQGREALEAKFRGFEAMLKSQRWRARNVLVKDDLICIEWYGELHLADGRRVVLDEVAIHELDDGKICAERFYYDPSRLASPTQKDVGKPSGGGSKSPAGPPPVLPEFDGKPPPIDPLDL